jgi:hypothetical protein
MQSGGKLFGRALGKIDRLRLHAKTLGQSWIKGLAGQAVVFLLVPLHQLTVSGIADNWNGELFTALDPPPQ